MKNSIGFYIFVLLVILTPISIIGGIIITTKNAYEEQQWVESKLNTKYVLNKDTLIITDYSNLNNTFILSNGIEINQNLLK